MSLVFRHYRKTPSVGVDVSRGNFYVYFVRPGDVFTACSKSSDINRVIQMDKWNGSVGHFPHSWNPHLTNI